MLRRDVIKRKELSSSFEFSQSYVFFYDKMERMNYNLHLVERWKKDAHEMNSRLVQHLLKEPFGDGGQWVMFTNVANKYGLVPKDVYPESLHSGKSAGVNMVLSRMFRTMVKDIYAAPAQCPFDRDAALQKTYDVLVRFFGEPPREFQWNYACSGTTNTNTNTNTFRGTPVEFMRDFCAIDLSQYVSLTHDPRNEYNALYGVEHLGNVVGGEGVKYLNLDMERLMQLTKRSIDDNAPVWFGSDVGQFLNSKTGVLDQSSFDYVHFLGLNDTMTKKDRIECCESLMTHAMVFVGYNTDSYGKVDYWKIENSWGTDGPFKGHLMCSHAWFKEYTYQLVLPKRLLSAQEGVVWGGEISKHFPLWDPMGSLAS